MIKLLDILSEVKIIKPNDINDIGKLWDKLSQKGVEKSQVNNYLYTLRKNGYIIGDIYDWTKTLSPQQIRVLYHDLKQAKLVTEDNILPKTKISTKHYEEILKISNISQKDRDYIQAIINTVKKQGDMASKRQINVLKKFAYQRHK